MEGKTSKPPRRRPVDERVGQDGLFRLPEADAGSVQGQRAEDEGTHRPLPRGKYPKLDDFAPFACVILDKSGLIREANGAAADLLHADRELLPGNPLGSFVTPQSRNEFLAHLKRITGKGKRDRCKVEIGADGFGRSVRFDSVPLARGGRLTGVYSTILDITIQKRAEALLHESEERHRVVVERSNDGIAIVSGDRLLYVNPRYSEIFGYRNADEAVGQGLRLMVHPEDRDRFFDIMERKARKGEHTSSRFEFRGFGKDGSVAYIEASVSRTIFEGEAALLVTFHDFTERKQAEDERKRLALIVEQAVEMILMTDRDGVVQYVNNAFLQSSGKKRAEVIGAPVRDCAESGDEDFYKGLGARLQRERKWNGRMTLKRPDGRFSELDVAVSPMRDASGLLLNYVIVCRDVTTEAVLSQQLRQIQKMEAIQTLAGGIAHDFNNLLAAIMGNVELAMDDVAADSDVLHNLEQIFKASRRGKDLVKQILLFSRRDQRESVLVEAGPLVTETMNLLRSSIPAAIDIRRHVEPGRSTVLADAGRLQQILMNLVSNAVHAMQEKGGVLDVVVREYQLTDDNASLPHLLPGAYLMIGVSDSGHGMSQGVMERIFEPFFTTKRPGEGPGMGLAVVHGIVKALKGAVAVSSELGKGSTFAVYLPIATSETERTVKEESRPLPRGEERILFVDDEKPIIEMNSALLERLGYHVNAVGNSAEALDLFTAAPDAFDLVITDQSMPDLTGIELVERIRSVRKHIPIIMITGFSETIDAERAKKMGIQQFLMKPVIRRELAEVIRNVLDGPSMSR